MFAQELVQKYSDANQRYKPNEVVKTIAAAVALMGLVALDLKYTVGCDCEWTPRAEADAAARTSGAAKDAARPVSGEGRDGDNHQTMPFLLLLRRRLRLRRLPSTQWTLSIGMSRTWRQYLCLIKTSPSKALRHAAHIMLQ
jgi:hypothetical protein